VNHPLWKTWRLIGYMSIWILLAFAGTYFQRVFFNVSWWDAGSTSLINSGGFSVVGFWLWYFVSQSWSARTSFLRIAAVHFFACVVVVLLWAFGTYSMSTLILADDPAYLRILQETLPMRVASGVSQYILIVLVYFLFLNFEDRRMRIASEARLREMLKESELNLLKSQINPHFLFNSLNSASLLTLTAPDKAREMIIALSEYLRYSISGKHDTFASLRAELENAQRYLEIERIRFGEKLALEFHVAPDCYAGSLPAMILQPLYENAIKHGVYEATGKVWITTKATVENDMLKLDIANTHEDGTTIRKGAGLGLRNVRDRLQMLYGEKAWLKIVRKENLFEVSLSIPMREL